MNIKYVLANYGQTFAEKVKKIMALHSRNICSKDDYRPRCWHSAWLIAAVTEFATDRFVPGLLKLVLGG